jgi:hypothetical protein
MTTTSQTKCDVTTDGNIPNTSVKEKQAKTKKFSLLDLHRLTFNLEGVEQTLNVETASPSQFNVFASEMADVEDVDVNVWPLEVRRDFVNDLWNFCLTNEYEFPLTEVVSEDASEAKGE